MDNNEPQNCWEFYNCPEKERNECPAYTKNMGRKCWMIASSLKKSGCFKAKGEGMKFCMNKCEWFKKRNPNFDKKL